MIKLEIETKKRHRGKTMRPSLSISREIWNFFCLKYPVNKHRDKIIEDLLIEQIENKVVDVPQIEFKIT